MNRDLGNNLMAFQSIAPASITATTTGSVVDLSGYESAMAVIGVGAVAAADATNYVTFKVQVGDESDGSDMADATMYAVKTSAGATWDRLINATTEENQVYLIGFKTLGKKYARVVGTETLTTTAIYGATIVMGNPWRAPAVA